MYAVHNMTCPFTNPLSERSESHSSVLRNVLNTSPVNAMVVADGGNAASQTEKRRYKKKKCGPSET